MNVKNKRKAIEDDEGQQEIILHRDIEFLYSLARTDHLDQPDEDDQMEDKKPETQHPPDRDEKDSKGEVSSGISG
jgi:hypothetical protein